MDMLNFIKSRRSTRSFKPDPIREEDLNAILEAGRYAPSGCNSQTTHFMVIDDPEVLDRLRVLTVQEFAKMDTDENTYPSLAHAINASKAGTYVFSYHCPVLIVTANKKEYGNNMVDCACALENMMLMANALDLGSVWINQLRWLNENPELLEYMQSLGLREDERIYGAVAIGYADTADGMPVRKPLPRTGNEVTYIRKEF